VSNEIKIVRITTVPISLKVLLKGQFDFMQKKGFNLLAISAKGKESSEISTEFYTPHLEFPLTRKITPIIDLYCLIKLTIFFSQYKPTIVHSHTPKAGLIGMLAARLAGVPIKIHTIAGLPLMTAKGLKKKLLVAVEKLTYWAADEVLPNSKSMYDYLLKERLINQSKLKIIGEGSSNGFDENQFNIKNVKETDIELIKKEINYNPDNFYLLFVGRMVVDKGLIEMIESFAQLKKTYSNLKLIILGEFENELSLVPEEIKDIIKNDSSIYHLGWQDDVQNYLSISNLLIHPSHREGFPNIVLQAAAMNCPIMCSRIPGNIDIVSSNRVGYLFNANDRKSLINVFENVYADYDLAKSKSEVLNKYIWENFPRKKVHQKIYQYYISKLEEKKLPAINYRLQEINSNFEG
jgi:glycosyltransferase involved in cell wall biosynthesis